MSLPFACALAAILLAAAWSDLCRRRIPNAVPAAITGPETRGPSQIELQMANGRCLRFDAALEAATLMNVIRAVEGA